MISTLRDYAYSDEHNQPCVMKVVFDYIMRAHKTYLDAIYAWIEEADEKQRQKLYVSAYPRVRDLMKKYDPSLKRKIERCYENSLLDSDERCTPSRESAESKTTSRCSYTTENNIDIELPTTSKTVKGDQMHLTPGNPVDIRPLTINKLVKDTPIKEGDILPAKITCDFSKPLFGGLPMKNDANENYAKKRQLQSHLVPEASEFAPLISETYQFKRPPCVTFSKPRDNPATTSFWERGKPNTLNKAAHGEPSLSSGSFSSHLLNHHDLRPEPSWKASRGFITGESPHRATTHGISEQRYLTATAWPTI